MREHIQLECTECRRRNYNSKKDKKKNPERLEIKKFCKFCGKHVLHREIKK